MIRPLALVWMGIVIGVSFLATPVKFTADSLTRPVALDVGRATFHALAYLEWVLAALLAVLIWRTATHQQSIGRRALTAAAVVAVVVVVQSAWLQPELDERVASIIAVSRDGDVMPQKSTYFYPKALTGLVLNPHEW